MQKIINIDKNSTIDDSKLPIDIRTDLPQKIIDMIMKKEEPEIGKITITKHAIHIRIDPNAKYGLEGLPKEWEQRLEI